MELSAPHAEAAAWHYCFPSKKGVYQVIISVDISSSNKGNNNAKIKAENRP